MQVELRQSELNRITRIPFTRMNPRMQRSVAVRVLQLRNTEASNFVADQILRGNPKFELVVADDVSQLT